MTFPTLGSGTWELTEAQAAEWQAVYKRVDVIEECSRALAWLRANPTRLKKNVPRFLNNWLKDEDRKAGVRRAIGAYVEPKGARPAPTNYSTEYWRLRGEGLPIPEAAATARKLTE